MLKESKIHFFWTDDAVASFISSTVQMQMSIWRSELVVDSLEIWTNARKIVASSPKTNEESKDLPDLKKL